MFDLQSFLFGLFFLEYIPAMGLRCLEAPRKDYRMLTGFLFSFFLFSFLVGQKLDILSFWICFRTAKVSWFMWARRDKSLFCPGNITFSIAQKHDIDPSSPRLPRRPGEDSSWRLVARVGKERQHVRASGSAVPVGR